MREHEIPVISFEKGQRKEDLAAKYLTTFSATEGVLFIGKAQEKVRTFRTEGSAQRPRRNLSLDRRFHGDGQPILLLCHR